MDTTRQALEKAIVEVLNKHTTDLESQEFYGPTHGVEKKVYQQVAKEVSALTSMDAAPQGVVEAGDAMRDLILEHRRWFAPGGNLGLHDNCTAKVAAWDAAKSRTIPAEPDTVEKVIAECLRCYKLGLNGDRGWPLHEADLRTRLTPLSRTTPAVALRSGGYDNLWKWLKEGGEAVGMWDNDSIAGYNPGAVRFFTEVMLILDDQGNGWDKHRDTKGGRKGFIADCTRLGLKYILIQPEQK